MSMRFKPPPSVPTHKYFSGRFGSRHKLQILLVLMEVESCGMLLYSFHDLLSGSKRNKPACVPTQIIPEWSSIIACCNSVGRLVGFAGMRYSVPCLAL